MGESIDIRTYSPLTLAFMGDAVFELIVREKIVREADRAVDTLHKHKAEIVNATAQARMAERLMDHLTEDEMAVFKRGRNAKTKYTAKHADVVDYRKATGLEALYGYLYLTGQKERMDEITAIIIESGEENG